MSAETRAITACAEYTPDPCFVTGYNEYIRISKKEHNSGILCPNFTKLCHAHHKDRISFRLIEKLWEELKTLHLTTSMTDRPSADSSIHPPNVMSLGVQ